MMNQCYLECDAAEQRNRRENAVLGLTRVILRTYAEYATVLPTGDVFSATNVKRRSVMYKNNILCVIRIIHTALAYAFIIRCMRISFLFITPSVRYSWSHSAS